MKLNQWKVVLGNDGRYYAQYYVSPTSSATHSFVAESKQDAVDTLLIVHGYRIEHTLPVILRSIGDRQYRFVETTRLQGAL